MYAAYHNSIYVRIAIVCANQRHGPYLLALDNVGLVITSSFLGTVAARRIWHSGLHVYLYYFFRKKGEHWTVMFGMRYAHSLY